MMKFIASDVFWQNEGVFFAAIRAPAASVAAWKNLKASELALPFGKNDTDREKKLENKRVSSCRCRFFFVPLPS